MKSLSEQIKDIANELSTGADNHQVLALHEELLNFASLAETLETMPNFPRQDYVEHVAQERTQQDWNHLEYTEIYRKAFLDGAKFVVDSMK